MLTRWFAETGTMGAPEMGEPLRNSVISSKFFVASSLVRRSILFWTTTTFRTPMMSSA